MLVREQYVRNSQIKLNLFGKREVENQQKVSQIARELYEQLSGKRGQDKNREKPCHGGKTEKRKSIPSFRAQTALSQKESFKFSPWDV